MKITILSPSGSVQLLLDADNYDNLHEFGYQLLFACELNNLKFRFLEHKVVYHNGRVTSMIKPVENIEAVVSDYWAALPLFEKVQARDQWAMRRINDPTLNPLSRAKIPV